MIAVLKCGVLPLMLFPTEGTEVRSYDWYTLVSHSVPFEQSNHGSTW